MKLLYWTLIAIILLSGVAGSFLCYQFYQYSSQSTTLHRQAEKCELGSIEWQKLQKQSAACEHRNKDVHARTLILLILDFITFLVFINIVRPIYLFKKELKQRDKRFVNLRWPHG